MWFCALEGGDLAAGFFVPLMLDRQLIQFVSQVPSCADNTKSGKCNKAGGVRFAGGPRERPFTASFFFLAYFLPAIKCVWMNNECVEGSTKEFLFKAASVFAT